MNIEEELPFKGLFYLKYYSVLVIHCFKQVFPLPHSLGKGKKAIYWVHVVMGGVTVILNIEDTLAMYITPTVF